MNRPKSLLLRYALALLVTALATAVRFALDPWLGPILPFIAYYPAVAVLAWYAGPAPAALSAALGIGAANVLFLAPRGSLFLGPSSVVSLVLFLTASALIILMAEAAHRRHLRGLHYREQLGESEQRFRTMADSAPMLIWMSDPLQRRVYFNRSWLEYTGRSLEQEQGDGWLESVHADDLPALETVSRALEDRLPFTTQFRLRSAGGEYRWMLDSGAPRFASDGKFLGFVGSMSDIHDRKLADESRAWLASIVAAANAAIVSKNLEGRILSWNAGAERIFGYSAKEAVGRSIDLIIPPELREEEREILRRLGRGERIADFETTRMTKDGRRVSVSLTISPVLDETGRVVGASKVVRDITAEKQAEAALRSSEERYRAVVESQTEALCRFRRDGTILFVNGAYARLRNAEPEDLIGRSFWQFIAETDRKMVGEMIHRLTPDAPEIRVENRFETAEGVRWMLWTNRALLFDASGRWSEAQSTGIDITERKRMEEALRDSEQRFARFMKHLPGLAWIKDSEGRYVFANEAAELAFGRSSRELYGCTDDEIFPHETAEAFRENDRLALEDEAGVQSVETLTHPDGSTRHSLVSKFPIPTPDGQHLVGGVAIDITERRRAEEALRESDRRKDAFLAILGHELRNPLAPLRTGLELLGQSTAIADSQGQRVLLMMERQLTHLLRLVDDLLDVSRISRGKLKLNSSTVELGLVIGAAVEQAQPLITERGHRLVLHGTREPLTVNGDSERLTQVFSNLLTNAARFMNDGGIIELETAPQGDAALVCVRDKGFGIPSTHLHALFETFSQVPEHYLRTGGGGLGIGLALAKSIVELHGGTITATSEGLGKGSEFVVSLPLAPARQASIAFPADSAPRAHVNGTTLDVAAATRRKNGAAPPIDDSRRNEAESGDADEAGPGPSETARRVLIVDDNADAADTLGMFLEAKGYLVKTAYDGDEALLAVGEFRPAAVLLDIGLPGLDGYEVARRIRAMPGGSRLLLCAITGWGQAEDKRRARDAGFDRHVTKPVEPASIAAMIADA